MPHGIARRRSKKNLIITYNVYNNPASFDCKSCTWGRHCDKDKKIEGSQGPSTYPKFVIEFGKEQIRSNVCFLPMINLFSRQLFDYYRHYKNGYLLIEGGLLDQPAIYLESMKLIESLWQQDQNTS